MPAVSIDGENWEIESSQILAKLGYEPISRGDLKAVQGAWQGVLHRADNPLHFLSSFARVGDKSTSLVRRSVRNFLRSFVALYMLTLINLAKRTRKAVDPDNFGDQFLVWEKALDTSSGRFIDGESPGIRDFLLFGVVQCHASIPTPPLKALQHDVRLTDMRQWIGRMQERFRGCSHLYSGRYFEPSLPQPTPADAFQRVIFYLGFTAMCGLFPLTLPLVFVLMRKVPR
ncbi:MAG: hypothetical protein NXH85_11965 [Pseudomonadaceae bacterium]|nr:hypothetical protein [Pseudomonadaceae bacterium]